MVWCVWPLKSFSTNALTVFGTFKKKKPDTLAINSTGLHTSESLCLVKVVTGPNIYSRYFPLMEEVCLKFVYL